MGSSRLPGKVLAPLGSATVLAWVVRAARASRRGRRGGRGHHDRAGRRTGGGGRSGDGLPRGPRPGEDDVLTRFLLASKGLRRRRDGRAPHRGLPAPGSCRRRPRRPQLPGLGADYLSTGHVGSLPRGLDVEVTSAGALRRIDALAEGSERVHVMPRFYRHPEVHPGAAIVFAPDASDLRVTLDTPEDAQLIEALVELLGDRPPEWRTVVRVLRERPDLVALNAAVRQKALEDG